MRSTTTLPAFAAVGVSGSPSRTSRSRRLLMDAVRGLEAAGGATQVVDLAELPGDDLLGRSHSAAIEDVLASVAAAHIVVVSTPVYRASYSGLLKVFFDLLPPDALADKVAIPIATGGGPAHQLVLDHALRPLLASVGALTVTTGVYGTDAGFEPAGPDRALLERVERAVAEALLLTSGASPVPAIAGAGW